MSRDTVQGGIPAVLAFLLSRMKSCGIWMSFINIDWDRDESFQFSPAPNAKLKKHKGLDGYCLDSLGLVMVSYVEKQIDSRC